MFKASLIAGCLLAAAAVATAVAPPRAETDTERRARMKWWTEARFGMFIHWGLYALPARHEWVRSREKISDEDYARYFAHFDPDLYDPREWARAARQAGMKYFVVTTKHHEGFCLWDSKLTDYKATRTPYGKDLIRPLVEAMRAEGLRVGFYHSLLDWHHPEYTIDAFHPMRDDKAFVEKARTRDMAKYADYLYAQVKELMTDFGRIDTLFMDYSFPGPAGKGRNDWKSERLLRMIRELQPGIIVNETCQTFSGSWGYDREEATWKSVRQLVVMLVETVSKGGNLLLNVGPTARGTFDGRAVERLQGIGAWMAKNGRSVYACTQAPAEFPKPANCLLTYNPETKRLYVHMLEWPLGVLALDGLAGRVEYAQLLHDASEVPFTEKGGEHGFMPGSRGKEGENTVTLRLPVRKPDVEVPVIELFLK
jgi:alpha-L-fucosidase